MQTRTLTHSLLCLFLLVTANSLHAAEPVSKSYFSGVAIDGHDTVAYHKIAAGEPHKAVKGKKNLEAQLERGRTGCLRQRRIEIYSPPIPSATHPPTTATVPTRSPWVKD